MPIDLLALQARAAARLRTARSRSIRLENMPAPTSLACLEGMAGASAANAASVANAASLVRIFEEPAGAATEVRPSQVSQVSQVSQPSQVGQRGRSAFAGDLDSIRSVAADSSAPTVDGSVAGAPRVTALRDRLVQWGWAKEVADETARRLAARAFDDTRVTCVGCERYAPASHRCREPGRAGMGTGEIGPALAGLPQACPAHVPNPDWPDPPAVEDGAQGG